MNEHTVLIVDDDDDIRMLAADAIAANGYDVITAASASEALTLLAEGAEPILVVTDLQMPGMDGDELCLRMRTLLGQGDLQVVLMSADVDGHARAVACGADQFLAKPIDEPRLLRALCASISCAPRCA
ncbi:MAG TPA: response regulator [Myxococcota bacterium]